MNCHCKHHFSANVDRQDPTNTKTIVKRFDADLRRRFKDVRRQIKIAIVDNDVFGLNLPNDRIIHNDAPPPNAFAFRRDPDKVDAFMEWLRRENDQKILEIITGTPIAAASQTAWSNVYIRASYDKGVRQSGADMRRQGAKVSSRFIDAAFNRPIHADAAGLIFTRTFRELDGITKTMEGQMARVLTQGIIEGDGARELARKLTNRVDKIGITRARVLARTEVVAAHAEAKLNLFEEAGAEGVMVMAEFSTAGDDQVCPECEALQGKQFTIEESHGVIPVHPNSYSDDTEIYIHGGWRFVKDIKVGDQCLSLNPETFDLGYKPVIRTFEHKEQEMVHFLSRNFDLLVTPDHDVFCLRREREWTNKRNWEFIKAKDVKNETRFYRSSKWVGDDRETIVINGQLYDTGDFCEFMGWWQSEGSFNRKSIVVNQCSEKNSSNYEDIVNLINRMPHDNMSAKKDRVRFRNDSLREYLIQFGKSYEKFIPEEIKYLSPIYLLRYLDAYCKGDGHEREGKTFKGHVFGNERIYTTSSKMMADGIGELLIKVGKRPSYSLRKTKGKNVKHSNGEYTTNHDIWVVSECNGQTSILDPKTGIKKSIVDYGRMTYCVELPEWHTLLVRRK
jgi:SPP1 gp7 family putative phage head morphogenesis protein